MIEGEGVLCVRLECAGRARVPCRGARAALGCVVARWVVDNRGGGGNNRHARHSLLGHGGAQDLVVGVAGVGVARELGDIKLDVLDVGVALLRSRGWGWCQRSAAGQGIGGWLQERTGARLCCQQAGLLVPAAAAA